MHDRRDGGHDRQRSPHEHGREERHESGPDCDGPGGEQRGGGPDTRFLQLELSQVLYSEAESVAREAVRELLLEGVKARFRERFGDQIAALAQLAADELMTDILYNLDIENRIRERNEAGSRTRERVRDIFAPRRPGDEPQEGGARQGRPMRRRGKR